MEDHRHQVTRALIAASSGSEEASNKFWRLVYDELRRIARRQLSKERSGHTLTTTALVHEAYLQLIDQTRVSWQNRSHFYYVAAEIMRRILVSYARKRLANRRGGGVRPITFEEDQHTRTKQFEEILAIDDALNRLDVLNNRLRKVVELRYFGGMSHAEIAKMFDVSSRTIDRDWMKAKAWLYKEIYAD